MLSKRLQTVADMVTPGKTMADIGTDHGYVPIYLIKNNIVPKAYAMDINEGPVKSAIENVAMAGLSDRIDIIQSDGMEKLETGMAESVVIAGMGGELIARILSDSPVIDSLSEMILSPHRDWDVVRRYICNIGWHIEDEKMLIDASKYYVVIKVVPGKINAYSDVEMDFGPVLLKNKDEILKSYLEKEIEKFEKIKLKVKDEKQVDNINATIERFKAGLEFYC